MGKYNEAKTLLLQALELRNQGTAESMQAALEKYAAAQNLYRQTGSKSYEAECFNNMGFFNNRLGEKQKALEFYNQALPILRAVGDKSREATTLTNIGSVYSDLGEMQKALEYFQTSLPLRKAVGDKSGEANTLDWLRFYWKSLNNPRFATFYGKQSVNLLQKLRSNINALDKEIQRTYLKSIEHAYRRLADILIAEGRLSEAQQILNSFKDQQYFDFDSSKQTAPLALTERETALLVDFNQKPEAVANVIRRLNDFKRSIGNRQMTAPESDEIKALEKNLQTASNDYQAFLKTAEKQFAAPLDEKDKIPPIADLLSLQATLRETSAATKQNIVAVYTLVGDDNYRALIITSDSIKSVSTPIKKDVLNEKARQFWALLQSPAYDPTKLGKELYDTVFKPLEKELPANTKTILWSLDGNLRYVPMAALFDGERYLVERYNHVNFTRADKERMTRAVSPNWTATGFGTSNAQTVDLLGEKISFNALPGVGEEMKTIFKQDNPKFGIFDGATLQDARFTKASFLAALRQKRPLVHIASHFAFQAGDESRSFLLLGDGTAMTLDEMKKQPKLFEGVEMLTLSACNTAAQQADATLTHFLNSRNAWAQTR